MSPGRTSVGDTLSMMRSDATGIAGAIDPDRSTTTRWPVDCASAAVPTTSAPMAIKPASDSRSANAIAVRRRLTAGRSPAFQMVPFGEQRPPGDPAGVS